MYPSPLKKEFCCVAQWRIPNRNCKYLFLEDIFPQNKDSLKQASLELQKIKEKYGMRESAMYQDVPAGYNGIIAKWFTGRLFVCIAQESYLIQLYQRKLHSYPFIKVGYLTKNK